jgi:hypothetical protein
MKKLEIKHPVSAIEKLKKMTFKIVFSEDVKAKQPKLSEKEFRKMAQRVSKTFPDDYFAQSQAAI